MKRLHIWLGTFKGAEDFKALMKETYSEDEDVPINGFAQSQGVFYYDHDWVESRFMADISLRDLIIPHSFSASYLEPVIQEAAKRGIETANVFILSDAELFEAPKSYSDDGNSLIYLGVYDGATP